MASDRILHIDGAFHDQFLPCARLRVKQQGREGSEVHTGWKSSVQSCRSV